MLWIFISICLTQETEISPCPQIDFKHEIKLPLQKCHVCPSEPQETVSTPDMTFQTYINFQNDASVPLVAFNIIFLDIAWKILSRWFGLMKRG